MASTIALSNHGGKQPSAPLIATVLDFTSDTSYPNPAGWPFNPGALLQSLAGYDKAPEVMSVLSEPKGDYYAQWDRSDNSLHFYLVSTGAEVANTVDLSTTPGLVKLLVLAK